MALLLAAAGSVATADWALDFGTPGSKTRPGFTKVSSTQVFAPGQEYGFGTAEGLRAIDRGGSYWAEKKPHPTNKALAAKYGPYRMTSYTNCDFVEGTQDNAFLLRAPDGEYEVWAVVSDPAEEPPFFEIRANGETKHKVRLRRRGFVFVEPFRARAEEGVLRIEFAGPHGWLLNALVVGLPGEKLAETVAEMERDIFFAYPEHQDDWRLQKRGSKYGPPALTREEQARGYVVFSRDYTEKVYPFTCPDRREIDRPLTASATPGEFEPASTAIYPTRDLGVVNVEVSDFTNEDGDRISQDRVEVGIVRCWAQRRGSARGGSGPYEIEPELIEPAQGRVRKVEAGETKQWWFTTHVPQDAASGRYRAQVTFTPQAAAPVTVEWRLLVLPFKLGEVRDRHWGTWLDTFPPLGGLRGPASRGRSTPEEKDRVARLEIEDFRDHGFDVAILEASGMRINENADGTFSYHIGALRRQMEHLKILGEQAVVPICFEYLCRRIEYRYAGKPRDEHVAGNFSAKAREAIVGLVRYLEAERARNSWPQFLYLPIDEPGNSKTANRMTFGRNVLEMVQSVAGARTACTITASGVQQLGGRINTRIYANGHVNRDVARRDAANGFPYWCYANGMVYGASTIASRNYPGFEFLRSGAQCATGWGFAAYHNNPYNDLDGTHPDWCVLLPGADGSIPTIYWELCREGVDDCRYVATLQALIEDAADRQGAERARALLEPLLDPYATSIEEPRASHRYRWRIAREIVQLSGHDSFTPPLSFTPVASASPMKEVLGGNVIHNPSFEDGPKEDGLPGWPYPFSDPYTEDGKKPAGAISVTDEIAHEGRYSLKWDLSKSQGLGSKYGNSRWLIINVQVGKDKLRGMIGRRVRAGIWVRTGGGTLSPGFHVRMSCTREGKYQHLTSFSYRGGLEDPAVWNRFEVDGLIVPETESIDIHIPCKIPDDPAVRDAGLFYIDDVSIRPIETVPITIASPLDEVYVGEPVPWQASTAEAVERLTVALLLGDELVQQTDVRDVTGPAAGVFSTDGLAPGVYRLQPTAHRAGGASSTAWREVIVAPDPFAW